MITKAELHMQMNMEINSLRSETYEKLCEIAIKYGKKKALDELYKYLWEGLEDQHCFIRERIK